MRKRSARQIRRLIDPTQSERRRVRAPSGDRSHHIYDYLHLAAALGASPEPLEPRFEVSPQELKEVQELVVSAITNQSLNLPDRQLLLGVNPGAEYGPAKRWPIENFAGVIREVSRRNPEALWLLFGGANDRTLCRELETSANVPSINLAGKTSLRQLMAMLKICRVLVTNDTGPMHVAAALGTPVVVPFGSTTPTLTAPGLPGDSHHHLLTSQVPCSPCFRRTCPIDLRCMKDITVEMVVESVCSVLSPR